MRWALILVVLGAAGCVYEPKCVDGYVRGPDDRCMPDTTSPDGGMRDAFAGRDSSMPGVDAQAPDMGMACDAEEFVMGRRMQCEDPADRSILMTEQPLIVAGDCAIMCGADDELCMADCVSAALGLSPDCSECVAATTLCGVSQCLGSCADDPTNPDCARCICEESDCPSCAMVFAQCAGIPAPFCGGMLACDEPTPFPVDPPAGAPARCQGSTRQCLRECFDGVCVDECVASDSAPPTPSGDTCADCVYDVSLACLSRDPECEPRAEAFLCCLQDTGCSSEDPSCCEGERQLLYECSFSTAGDCGLIDNDIYEVCF